MDDITTIIGKVIAHLIIIPLIAVWLWNTLLPDMFGFPVVNFWQVLGLMILVNSFSPVSKES